MQERGVNPESGQCRPTDGAHPTSAPRSRSADPAPSNLGCSRVECGAVSATECYGSERRYPCAIVSVFVNQRGYLTRIARRYLHDRDDAEDIVQGVIARLLSACVCPTGVSRSYVCVAVRNAALMELRRQRRQVERTLVLREAEWLPAETEGDRERLLDLALDALRQLPARCADVARLRAEGLSYEAVANELGIARKTVDAHLQRARRLARSLLDQHMNA